MGYLLIRALAPMTKEGRGTLMLLVTAIE